MIIMMIQGFCRENMKPKSRWSRWFVSVDYDNGKRDMAKLILDLIANSQRSET
jgi:hypothetical protein